MCWLRAMIRAIVSLPIILRFFFFTVRSFDPYGTRSGMQFAGSLSSLVFGAPPPGNSNLASINPTSCLPLSGVNFYSNQAAVVSSFISTPPCPTFGSSGPFPCSMLSTSVLLQYMQSIQPSQSLSCGASGSLISQLAPTASKKDQPPTGKRKFGDHLRGAHETFICKFNYSSRTILSCVQWKSDFLMGREGSHKDWPLKSRPRNWTKYLDQHWSSIPWAKDYEDLRSMLFLRTTRTLQPEGILQRFHSCFSISEDHPGKYCFN
jgi:hypothetical protein